MSDTEQEQINNVVDEAKEFFKLASEAESENRKAALDDIEFALLSKQWNQDEIDRRQRRGRPTLTINKLATFVRQVVNDSRQNKPAIHVQPVDDNADVETAEVITGLIRNIETNSKSDVAYDTAITQAVAGGFGYFRINIDYAHEDTFDQDILIERIPNQFSVFADPYSTAADSSDWNQCMIVERIPKDEFEEKYKANAALGWEDSDGYTGLDDSWLDDDGVLIAEYWKREEVLKQICQLSDGTVVDSEVYQQQADIYQALGLKKVNERTARSHKVTQYLITGSEVLETNEWHGKYIPIIPVYGEEIVVEGKRYFKSLVRDAKDPQRMFNYWRSTSTELVSLSPKTPFIGEEGAFSVDSHKWATANVEDHAFLQYKAGKEKPQRQPFAGVPAGVLQEALNASDDIKAVTGMFDASLGARGNETSGRAILARQKEGDTATFHFIDNLARAIRHAGSIVLDLIPHVYSGERVIRVLGEDGKESENVKIGEAGEQENEQGEIVRIYDLSLGKYDVVVSAGPSYNTKREEAAVQMTEFIRSFPQAAPLIGDLLAKNLDWPGADDIAKRFKAMLPPQAQENEDGMSPEMQQMQQQMQQMQQQMQEMMQQAQQQIQQTTAENQQLKSELDIARQDSENNHARAQIDAAKLETDRYKAETDRIKVVHEMQSVKDQTNIKMHEIGAGAKTKTSRAHKLDDGSWHIETIEAPINDTGAM